MSAPAAAAHGGTLSRIVVYSTVALVVLSVLLAVAVLAVNAIDEELSAEAKLLLGKAGKPPAPRDNLYIAFAGFDAPAGSSSIAAGEARIAEYDRISAFPHRQQQPAIEALSKTEGLTFRGDIGFCRPLVSSCWTEVETRRPELKNLHEANAELYRRYLDLHARPAYFETALPSFYAPIPFVPPSLRALFLSNAALRLKDARTTGQRRTVLADLDRDLRTWRVVLTGEGSLVSKMIAVAHLHGGYALLADAIGDRRIDLAPHVAEIEVMLDRLAPEDWKIGGVFGHEFRLQSLLFDRLRQEAGKAPFTDSPPAEGEGSWWDTYWKYASMMNFLQPNATKNLSARHFTLLQQAASADAAAYRPAHDEVLRWREKNFAPGLAYGYNPVGRILVAAGAEAWDSYPLRAYDAAAFHRLVRLGFEIRRQGISSEGVPAFMKRHPQWATHPVSGGAFAWDAEKQTIAVEPLGNTPKERRFHVPVLPAKNQ